MTWLSEASNVLDDAIEDEIRKELDLIEISDESLDENNEDLSNDTSQDLSSLHEDGTNADDAISHYASQLDKRASAFEQELLECDDLLTAATELVNVQVLQESWKLLPVDIIDDVHLTSAKRGLSEVDDNSESSDDDYLAIEWQPTTNAVGRDADAACPSPQPLPSAKDEALVIIDRAVSGHDHCHSARTEGQLLQIDVAHVEGDGNVLQHKPAASLATAASRERYRQAMANMEKDHDELKAKFDALEHQCELERAERAAKLQHDADTFRQKTAEKGEQLQKELDAQSAELDTYAAELQENIRKIDSELNQERMNLHNAVLATQAREREVQLRSAVTVQAAYRGYRVRKTHAATLLKRTAARREEAVASRIRQLEEERQLAAEAAASAERRRLEEVAAEAKRQLAEAEAKRKAEEAKAAEARQKAEEAAEAKRKAKEAKKRAKAEAAEIKRKAEEEEAKRRAEEAAEARRKAEEAAEAKRKTKEKEVEERRLRKEAEREARRTEKEQLRKLAEGSEHDKAAEEKADLASHCRDDVATTAATNPATGAQSAAAADTTAAQITIIKVDRDASAIERNSSNENVTENRMRGSDACLTATHSTTSQGAAGEMVIRTDSSSRGVIETSPMLTAFAKTGINAIDAANLQPPGSLDQRVLSGVLPINTADATSTLQTTAAADVIARQRSEQRLAEMQLLKERMEKLQPTTAVLSGSSGSRHPAAAASPTTAAIATAVAATAPRADSHPLGLDMSLVGSKMEERRLRWMKECVPWSSIRTEAANRKVPVQFKKPASSKQKPAASATSEVPASRSALLIAAVADEAGTTTEKVQAFHVEHVPDCSLNAAWSSCPDLKAVIVRHCQLVSLDGLSNDGSACAAGLLYVDCQANCIEKLPVAAHLDRLTVLDLTENHLTSMAGLEACPTLRYLCLAKNKLTRVAGLANLRTLHTLDVSQNQLINTKGVGDAVSLQFLDVSSNHLSAVDDVDRLCLLERLSASGNNIREVPKLQNAVLLRELLLGDNSVSSLGSLSHSWLPSLKRLVLNHNSLSSLAPLHGCPLLRFVDLGHNQLVDVHNVADALKFSINLDELLLDGSPVAFRASYRAQLNVLLPRMRVVDGVKLSDIAAVSELYPSDFLKACDTRSQQATELHQQWLEHTRIPTDRKLASVELLRLCSAHCTYFEQSSSHAQDSRSMHEYGELSEVRSPWGSPASAEYSAASNAVPLDSGSVQGASERSSAAPTMAKAIAARATPDSAMDANPREAATEHARAPSGDARQTQRDRRGTAPPASATVVARGDTSSTLDSRTADISGAQANRDILGLHSSGGRSNDESDDEIDAVISANRASDPSLTAVSKAASSSSGNRVRLGARESVSSATAESKDAFEERLRAALESTSKRLLEQSDRHPGAASVSDTMRASVLSAVVGNSSNNCIDREHSKPVTGTAVSSRNRSNYAESSIYSGIGRYQPTAVPDSLQLAATRIQATWRGYALRKRLNSALRHARVDSSDVDDFSDYGEVDVSAFDLAEARLDENWLPSQTPQLPKSHAALPSRFGLSAVAAADVLTISSSPAAAHEPRPPVQPRHAWRNQSSAGRGGSAAADLERQQQYGARELGSFSPALSGAHSHRSGLSRKEELLAEEWGFKDHRTAELMVQRAKKLKYDAIKKKKLRMLDPQQKLAFLRRLEEESTRPPPVVQVPVKKAAPKLEYFEAMEAEARRKQTDKRAEQAAKEQRMYEWVHTQVGDHYDSDDSDGTSPSSGRRRQGRIAQAAVSDSSPAWQHSAGSQDSLPFMEKRVIQGGRALLVASPLDLQSVDSREHEASQQYRRNSQAEPLKDGTQLPPIKTNSAQSSNARKERISFRDNKADLGPGWGGGRKRNFQR